MRTTRAATLHYSEPLVRRAIRAFWWRSTGWSYFIALFILLGIFVYLLATGNRSWWVGVFGAGLGMGLAMAVALYAVHFRSSLARFRRMKAKEATLEMFDDRFRMVSDVGTTECSWTVVIKVWRFPEFWLLFYSAAQFTTLPVSDLDAESQAFILERVKAHGAEVA